jgi:predicted 3-demethylubiquinone-9 3-methyltransferase (glyoxalase superfamily)
MRIVRFDRRRTMPRSITPNLWFDGKAEEAAEYYCSLFPDSRIVSVVRGGDQVLTVEFELMGQTYLGLNGGPSFQFTEAVSFVVTCEDQAEIDRYWDRLTADGGEPGRCGWCKDRYGLSWQVVPAGLGERVTDDGARRALFAMDKIDIAALRAAAGEGVAA